MFRNIPVSAAPAPTSIKRVTPREASKAMDSDHRTGLGICWIKSFASFGAGANLARLPVVDQRNSQVAKFGGIEVGLHPVLRGLQQRAMEGSAHRQQHGSAGAGGLGELDRAVDSGGVAGDDDLVGRIETRSGHNFALRSFRQDGVQLPGGKLKERRHRADTLGNRFLHVSAALADQPHGIGKVAAIRRRPGPSIRPGCGPPRKPE